MGQGSGSKRFVGTSLALAGVLFMAGSASGQASGSNSVPDAQIEANVLKALAGAPQLANENISTNTVYGTVTLSGSVKDEPTRQMAENLVSRANGVQKVVDELTLGASDGANGSAPMQDDSSQGNNSVLQSDGTMAPPQTSGQPSAPNNTPDWGPAGPPRQMGQSNPPDDSSMNGQPSPQPAARQPYNGANNSQPGPGYGQQPYGQQAYPQQGSYPNQQQYGQAGPPPYGAQQAGQHVVVPSGSLIRIRINEGLDSKHTQPGTPFDAVVLNDVVADGAVAIPRGASVQGTVLDAKSGGVIKGHGELSLQLTQVTLGGRPYPITSDVWSHDSSDKSLQTINSAIGLGAVGAIIGAVAGGGPGAAIGAGVGGAAGIGSSAASGSRQVLIPSEAILTFHLTQPAPMVTISQAEMDRLSSGVPVGAQMRRRYPPPPPGYYARSPYYPYPYPY